MLNKLFKGTIIAISASLLFFNMPVFANPGNETVEGDATRFVTGDAYASSIELAGYNVRSGDIHLNLDFTVPANTASIAYDVKIFNGSSINLGTFTGTTTSFADVNTTVTGVTALTKDYRTVVTVKSTTPNP